MYMTLHIVLYAYAIQNVMNCEEIAKNEVFVTNITLTTLSYFLLLLLFCKIYFVGSGLIRVYTLFAYSRFYKSLNGIEKLHPRNIKIEMDLSSW